MNRKNIALIIFILAVVGIYGLFYTAVTSVLIPQDLNEYKTELDALPQLPNDSDITEIENAAAITQSSSSLKYMSKNQRITIANEIRNSNAAPTDVLNQNFTDYSNFNNNKALIYALVLKGDLSSKIKNLSSTYEEISNLSNEMISLNQKMATDFENGDDKSYAEDLRNSANFMKQYNSKMLTLKTQLQNVINELSK